MSYATSLATAKRLLTSKGQVVTLTVETAGTYDPATATVTLTPSTITTVGVVLPLSQGVRGFKYGISDQPGTNLVSSDQQLLLPGDIDLPAAGTKATIGGTDYSIVAVSPINPGGTAVLYECVIRGAP